MKYYKLLKDLPTFNAGELFYLNKDGSLCADNNQGFRELIAYTNSTLRKFPNILTDWFEECPQKKERWRAECGATYWKISSDGTIEESLDRGDRDDFSYSIGNYGKPIPDGEERLLRLRNWLVAYRTILDDTKGFSQDVNHFGENPVTVFYNRQKKRFTADYCTIFDGIQPGAVFFRNFDDAENSLIEHPKEWETLLRGRE